jgi:nitroreductase
MELLEAIRKRRSIRAFKTDPIPKKVLVELLEISTRVPSSTNTQPWEFFVLTGEVLDKLNHTMVEKVGSGDIMKPRPDPDMDMFVILAKGSYVKRQGKLFNQLFKQADLLEPEEGKTKKQQWWELAVSN